MGIRSSEDDIERLAGNVFGVMALGNIMDKYAVNVVVLDTTSILHGTNSLTAAIDHRFYLRRKNEK